MTVLGCMSLLLVIIIINNQVLNKTKFAVEISSWKGHKYKVNMMKVWSKYDENMIKLWAH